MSKRILNFRHKGELYRLSYVANEKRQVLKVLDNSYVSPYVKNGRQDNWRKVLEVIHQPTEKPSTTEEIIRMLDKNE